MARHQSQFSILGNEVRNVLSIYENCIKTMYIRKTDQFLSSRIDIAILRKGILC